MGSEKVAFSGPYGVIHFMLSADEITYFSENPLERDAVYIKHFSNRTKDQSNSQQSDVSTKQKLITPNLI